MTTGVDVEMLILYFFEHMDSEDRLRHDLLLWLSRPDRMTPCGHCVSTTVLTTALRHRVSDC